jgi:O-methyltransferase
MSKLAQDLLKKYPIISDQVEPDELLVILTELEKALDSGITGDIVEFGCYTGTTSLFIQRMLIAKGSTKNLHTYDSFDGLPEKSKQDESPLGIDFKRGELRSTKSEFIHNFRKANLPLPIICKKWFHEVEDHEIPDRMCFAFLDGDYYKSIRSSLSLVLPRMQPGGIIIVDDYTNPALPGAKKAVDEVLSAKNIKTISSLAVLPI